MRATCVLVTFISLSAIAEESDFQRYYNAALRLHESLEYERALERWAARARPPRRWTSRRG
jgi:hypothetical protein